MDVQSCDSIWKTLFHKDSQQFKKIFSADVWPPQKIFKAVLGNNDSMAADIDGNQEICVDDEGDQSVKMMCSNVQIHIEKDALDELKKFNSTESGAETIESLFEEHLNHTLNSESTTASGYLGDDERTSEMTRDENGNSTKVYRKKFGVYPYYRIRFNGVKWMTYDSSDEEKYDESANLDECRGPRRVKMTIKESKNPKPSNSTESCSYNEGNDEESEPVIVHVISAKKRKMLTKRKLQHEEVDTTASEASDVESLTDCSLCVSNNLLQ